MLSRGAHKHSRPGEVPILAMLDLGRWLDHLVETLSMGQQQRVMLARALSTEKITAFGEQDARAYRLFTVGPRRILPADRPTGNLDRRRGDEVLDLLRRIRHEHDVATVLVTDDAHAVAFADRALTLEDGVLTEAIGAA